MKAARVVASVAGIAALTLAGGLWLRSVASRHDESSLKMTAGRKPPTPTLYCEFYNFMRNATVVSFLFAVENAKGGEPRFLEMAVVEPDGTRTEYDANERLRWSRASEDGHATIASPDAATRIVLFGFEPERPGIFWTEAGVRSDTYKNLEGKCRQANFGGR